MPLAALLRSPLVLTGAIAFMLVGAYQSSYGPSYPRFLEYFHVTQASVGWIASLTFIGATTAIFFSTWLLKRIAPRHFLTGAVLLLALGSLSVGLAPNWTLALLGALIAGVGAGSFTSGINVLLARAGSRGAGTLNVVNAMFGLGSVTGPLLVSATTNVMPGWPFVLISLLSLPLLLIVRRLPTDTTPSVDATATRTSKGGVSLFVLLLFLYVMTEVGAGSWLATHLTPSVGLERAAVLTSGFWLALTLGRFAIAPVAQRLQPQDLVTLSALLGVLAASLANFSATQAAGYVLLGLALAPIYPTTVAWFGQRFPAHLAPIAMTGGSLGAAAVQPLMGMVASAAGVQFIPITLAVFALATLAVAVVIRVSGRRGAAERSGQAVDAR